MQNPALYQSRLVFQHKAILTRGMLQELYNFPRALLSMRYQGYSNGICMGLEFGNRGGKVVVSPGLARVNGDFYILPQEVSLTELALQARSSGISAARWHCVLEPGESVLVDGVPYECLNMQVWADKPAGGDNIELASFSNQVDPELPDQLKTDLWDQFTQHSHLGLLDTPYAGPGGATFHPYVFAAVQNFLLQKAAKSLLDWQLLFMLAQDGIASLRMLHLYIGTKMNTSIFEPVSSQLFKLLCESLRMGESPQERVSAPPPPPVREKRPEKGPVIISPDDI